MFDEISLKKIDAKYFNIILLDNKDITLQSRNTGHYWYLHCTEYLEEQSLIIFDCDISDIMEVIESEEQSHDNEIDKKR